MDSDKLRKDRVEVWTKVRDVCATAGELLREAKRLRAEEGTDDREHSADPAARDVPKGPPATYSRRRQALRQALLTGLRPLLVHQTGEQQAALGLEPMVIAIDERERLALGPLAKRWSLPRLQVELLEIDDGGDHFYEMLRRHLDGSGTHPLVFELYLLCLEQGFLGRYEGREPERQAVIDRLVERVRREYPQRALAPAAGALIPFAEGPAAVDDGRRHKVTFISFPYRYYLGAACVAVSLFIALRVHAHHVVTRSAIGCACSASAQENPEECLGHDGR